MRIRIVQSGGFAGLRRERAVETGDLSPAQRQAVEGLIRGATFFDLPQRLVSGLPDVLQYRMEVQDSDRAHAITFDDQCATEPLRLLVMLLFESGGAET